MSYKYYSIEEILLKYVEPELGIPCTTLLRDNLELFKKTFGSTHNHQAWPGGFYDHTQEVMNYGIQLYISMEQLRPLPFTLSDALVVCFFHDIEKPWKYELDSDGVLQHRANMQTKADHHIYRMKKIREYGIELSPEIVNGIKYAEGELDDYTNKKRIMSPLAAFTHMCDVCSARIYFNHPLPENDPWVGSKRT